MPARHAAFGRRFFVRQEIEDTRNPGILRNWRVTRVSPALIPRRREV
jgi:hypothetical protein